MKINYFQVRATLVPADLTDFFNQNYLIENTQYFIKNTITGKFTGLYKVESVNCSMCAPGMVCNYCSSSPIQKAIHAHTLKELGYLTSRKILYKLSAINPIDQIYLIVRNARESDFFSADQLKENVVYYTISKIGNITNGPYYTEANQLSKIKQLLFQQEIYVIDKKQFFNEVENLKSA